MKNLVVTRYFNSQFMGHTTADDLVTHFCNALKPCTLSKISNISMDGPAVNWKFYKKMDQYISDSDESRLLETGSCGLHIVHNVFRKGVNSVD